MVEINLNRRQFLKLSGATAATLAVVELGFNEKRPTLVRKSSRLLHQLLHLPSAVFAALAVEF